MGLVTTVDTNHTRAIAKPHIGALLVAAALAASNLDSLVAQVYNQVQKGCTPRTPPQFQRIIWDGTGPTGGGGTGRTVDANPALGGPFSASWNLGPNAPAGAALRGGTASPHGR